MRNQITVRPMADNIVVKVEKIENKTKAGLELISATQQKPYIGTVVAVGPGRYAMDGKRIPSDLKVGDRVTFYNYAGTSIVIENEPVLVLRETDIFCVIE